MKINWVWIRYHLCDSMPLIHSCLITRLVFMLHVDNGLFISTTLLQKGRLWIITSFIWWSWKLLFFRPSFSSTTLQPYQGASSSGIFKTNQTGICSCESTWTRCRRNWNCQNHWVGVAQVWECKREQEVKWIIQLSRQLEDLKTEVIVELMMPSSAWSNRSWLSLLHDIEGCWAESSYWKPCQWYYTKWLMYYYSFLQLALVPKKSTYKKIYCM